MKEGKDRIALISDSSRNIIWTVALNMMSLDMMIVVGVPSVAHQWLQDIWKAPIE
jgi:hypothetical protein